MSKKVIMTTIKMNIEQKLDKEISSLFKNSQATNKFATAKKNLTYADFLSNKMLIIFAIRNGIPYSLFDVIQDYAPFSENDWANYLDLSTKSLHRYKQSSKQFKPNQSEKIIEIAEVTSIGLDVFGEMDKFKLWLDTPNFSLGNLKPMELLKDSYGKELVIGELTRINYGILV
jgi:putative toxin-antitoxin system antitoxin component (TIGR02293 family)